MVLVQNASLPEEKIEKTDLKNLASSTLGSPVIILAGEVANTFVRQNRILYTGIDPYQSLSNIPGQLIHYPLIE
ncbi:MAG: hypothetical protein ACP5QT_08870, partial [Brevinematia bacterium]